MSAIYVDSIKDKSDTKTLATLSSSAVTLDSSVVFPAGGTGNPISVAVIADEKSTTTEGGPSDSTADFERRDLNTVLYDSEGTNGTVTLSSSDSSYPSSGVLDQFTLGAGTYLINWACPAYKSNAHQSRLYDVTGTTTLESGSNEYSNASDNTQTKTIGSAMHTITSNNVYEIQQCDEMFFLSISKGYTSVNNFRKTTYKSNLGRKIFNNFILSI